MRLPMIAPVDDFENPRFAYRVAGTKLRAVGCRTMAVIAFIAARRRGDAESPSARDEKFCSSSKCLHHRVREFYPHRHILQQNFA